MDMELEPHGSDQREPMWLMSHLTQVFIASPQAPYWTGTGGDVIYGDCSGDVFVSMAVEGVLPDQRNKYQYNFKRGIEAWRRDGKRIWYLPDHNGNSMCYSPVKDTILVFETDPARIEELDAKTGRVLRTIDRTDAGPIGGGNHFNYGGSRVCYEVADHDRFWYADPDHHVVLLTDFSGKVHMQLGEYDQPGDDQNHFRVPKTVSNTNTWGRVLVGDTGNHRVVEYGPSFRFKEFFPFPEPYASYTVANQVAIYTGGNPCSFYGIFLLSDHLTCRPITFLPFNTDSFVVHPNAPTKVLIRWDDGLCREISMGDLNNAAPPTTARLFANAQGEKLSELISPPIIDFFRPKKSIVVKSTAPGKVLYEMAEFTGRAAKWNGNWSTVDTFTLKRDQALRITDSYPCTACRLRIVLEEAGTVDGWATLSA